MTRIVALLILLSPFFLWALSRTTHVQLMGHMVRRVHTQDKVVALTFDDGPRSPYTEEILDILKAEGVVATFFVVGENVEANPEPVERAVREGHQIGNHSWSHQRMVLKKPSWVRTEILDTDTVIRDAGAKGPIPFRSPYGKKLFVLPAELKRLGRTNFLFDVVPNPPDYRRPDPQVLHDYILEHTRPGSIILLHDGGGIRTETVEATRTVVPALRERGYEFVTVTELLTR